MRNTDNKASLGAAAAALAGLVLLTGAARSFLSNSSGKLPEREKLLSGDTGLAPAADQDFAIKFSRLDTTSDHDAKLDLLRELIQNKDRLNNFPGQIEKLLGSRSVLSRTAALHLIRELDPNESFGPAIVKLLKKEISRLPGLERVSDLGNRIDNAAHKVGSLALVSPGTLRMHDAFIGSSLLVETGLETLAAMGKPGIPRLKETLPDCQGSYLEGRCQYLIESLEAGERPEIQTI